MNNMKKTILLYMFVSLVGLSYFLSLVDKKVFAEEQPVVFLGDKSLIFNKEIAYDIYYEVGKYQTQVLENVKIVGTKILDGVTFLVIRYSEVKYSSEIRKEGYILLTSVKAILPSGIAKPKSVSDTGS